MIAFISRRAADGRPSPLRRIAALAVFVSQLAAGFAFAETAAPPREKSSKAAKKSAADDGKKQDLGQDWVRVEYDDDGKPVGMQTAIVRYKTSPNGNGNGNIDKSVEVDLIGAVHIGDVAYYQKLNRLFKDYDVLLYELVAPEGTVVERGRGTSNAHPVGAMQNAIKNLLELDHQLEYVDYTKPNFVHADMSPDEFAKSMRDRNESFLQMYFRLMGQAMAQQAEMTDKGGASDFDLFAALFSDDRPRRLKVVLSKQLSEMEGLMVSFGGDQGSTIISERNKKALGVLKKELADGKKKVGIFYGAGHLNDMDERLREEFNLEPVSIQWVTAWDLREKN